MTSQTITLRIDADGHAAILGIERVEAAERKLGPSGDRAGKQAAGGLDRIDKSAQKAHRSTSRLTQLLSGAAIIASVAAGARLADEYTNLSSKIALVTDSQREATAVQQQVFEIAQQTRSALSSTGDLYTKLARSTGDMNLSQQALLGITRTVNQSFVVSGASASAADAAIQQLGQGLASGALRGDEFNSVAEQAPIIMDLLAAKLNMTRGELRAFAAEGKITSEIMVSALAEGAGIVSAQFDQMQMTIGGAAQQIRNAITQWVGSRAAATGAAAAIALSLSQIAMHLPAIIDGLLTIGTIVVTVYAVKAVQAGLAWIASLMAQRAAIFANAKAMVGFGATTKATLAAGIKQFGALGLAVRGLAAIFIGWQIGTYLRGQFQIVADAGAYLVYGLAEGWTAIKFGAEGAGTAIENGASIAFASFKSVGLSAIDAVRGKLADLISGFVDLAQIDLPLGLEMDFTYGASAKLDSLAVSLRTTSGAAQEAQADLAAATAAAQVDAVAVGHAWDDARASNKAMLDSMLEQNAWEFAHKNAKGLADDLGAVANNAGKANAALATVGSVGGETPTGGQPSPELDAQAAAAMTALHSIYARNNADIAEMKAALAGASRAQIEFNNTQREAFKALQAAGGMLDPAAIAAYMQALGAAAAKLGTELDLEEAIGLDQLLQRYEQNSPFEQLIDDANTLKGALTEALNDPFKDAADLEHIERLKGAIGALDDQITHQMLGSYRALLGAVQTFTERGSDGFKTMEAGMAALSIAQDIIALKAGVTAVLTQGEGEPYSAWARMAAMAAAVAPFLASIGMTLSSLGGGGGGADATAQRQVTQGTGTVLGDAEAQSESIANAMEITADATSQLPAINRGMLEALTGVSKGIDGVTASISGMTFDFQHGADTSIGWWEDLFGGSVVSDSGLQIAGGKITDLINSVFVKAFEEVTVDEGWFGGTDTSTSLQSLGDAANTQFSLILQSIVGSVQEAAKALGLIPADIQAAIDAFQIETQQISLEGMTGEEKNEALKAVFSSIFDGLAAAVVPFIDQFQQVGEGLGETLVRVATEVQVMQEAVRQLGLTLDVTDPERFAQVSDALIELVGGVEAFITGMQAFADAFAPGAFQFQTASDTISMAFEQVGLAVPKTGEEMWALMQSLDASTVAGRGQIATLLRLAEVSDQYYDMIEARVQAQFDYASLSAGLQAEAGQNPLAASLIEIAEWSRNTTMRLHELAAAAGMAAARESDLSLVHQVAVQRMEAAIAALYDSSRALVDQLYGTDSAAVSASSAVSGFGAAMGQAAQDATDAINLLLGNLSPFGDRKKLDIALEGQRAGTVTPTQVLEIGRRLMASGADYAALFQRVMAVGDRTGGAAGAAGAGGGRAVREIAEKTLSKAERYQLADRLANNVADLAAAQDIGFSDVAEKLGLDLSSLGKDLGLGNQALEDYLSVLAGDNFGIGDLQGILAGQVDRLIAAITGQPIPDSINAPIDGEHRRPRHPGDDPDAPYSGGPDGTFHPTPISSQAPPTPQFVPADPAVIGRLQAMEDRIGAALDAIGKGQGRYLPLIAENTGATAESSEGIERHQRELRADRIQPSRNSRPLPMPVV